MNLRSTDWVVLGKPVLERVEPEFVVCQGHGHGPCGAHQIALVEHYQGEPWARHNHRCVRCRNWITESDWANRPPYAPAEYAEALARFLQAADAGIFGYADGSTWLELHELAKFWRLMTVRQWEFGRVGTHESAIGFIAKAHGHNQKLGHWAQGDVFYAQTYRSPAKHARGNIFDEQHRCFSQYGIITLR